MKISVVDRVAGPCTEMEMEGSQILLGISTFSIFCFPFRFPASAIFFILIHCPEQIIGIVLSSPGG